MGYAFARRWLTEVGPDQHDRVRRSRPRIPADIDARLLWDTSAGRDLSEGERVALRDGFWRALDEQAATPAGRDVGTDRSDGTDGLDDDRDELEDDDEFDDELDDVDDLEVEDEDEDEFDDELDGEDPPDDELEDEDEDELSGELEDEDGPEPADPAPRV